MALERSASSLPLPPAREPAAVTPWLRSQTARPQAKLVQAATPPRYTEPPPRRRSGWRFYPSSFPLLILAGFSLAVLPLIFALINNAISIHELASKSQRAVFNAVQATQTSRALMEQVTSMERSARQFSILSEQRLFDVFDTAHRDFIDTSRRMSTLTLLSDQARILSEMQRAEQALYDRVAAVRDQPRLVADIADDYVQLAELARGLDASGREVVIRETTSMQSLSGEVHNFIYWQLVALIPVALFLVTGATLLILRPIKQIESSLHRLGEGDFNHPVRVSGPRDLEDLGRQIDWVRVRLVELEEQKTRFLHQMSHELKTPLSAIREGTELLGDGAVGPLSPQQAEVARILHENALRLQRLIEDLLNYHTVQFQKSGLHLNHIDLASVIKRVAEAHRLPMRAKDLRLSIFCPPVAFQADENKLEVIIDNLLSNAVKFSPTDGEIVVSARRRGSELLLSVQDEGPGIPAAERERVFEPFFQGVATPQGSIKGTGLGLAIVREYVTAHSGRVEILDAPSPGAHIQVRLPLAPAAQAKA